MHFVKFLPRYLQQSVMKMQNLIKLGKNCKNILFRDNHLPFIQEQLMEKIKVNYKLALRSCHYHFPHCHHVTTYLWINTKLEQNWFTSMGQRVWFSYYSDVEYVTKVTIPVCLKYFWVWVRISRVNAYIFPLCLIRLI